MTVTIKNPKIARLIIELHGSHGFEGGMTFEIKSVQARTVSSVLLHGSDGNDTTPGFYFFLFMTSTKLCVLGNGYCV